MKSKYHFIVRKVRRKIISLEFISCRKSCKGQDQHKWNRREIQISFHITARQNRFKKKSLPKQKTIQNFTIDAQGCRKIKNENPPTWEMGVTS